MGGWTNPEPPTDKDMAVFDAAFGKLSGLSYQPLLVATQIVNGTNYAFFCEANAATATPQTGFVMAEAHESLEGIVTRTNITIYGMVPQSVNAWSGARLLTEHDTATFEKGVAGVKGVIHAPLLVSSQAEKNVRHRFFCVSRNENLPGRVGFTVATMTEDGENVKVVHVATFG